MSDPPLTEAQLLALTQRRVRDFGEYVRPDRVLQVFFDVDDDDHDLWIAWVELAVSTGLSHHDPVYYLETWDLQELTRRALGLPEDSEIEVDPERDEAPGRENYSRTWWVYFPVDELRAGSANVQVAGPDGLWRLDASGTLLGENYVLRWYKPGSRLHGPLRGRDFVKVYTTTSMKVRWLRTFVLVANELHLKPDSVDPRKLRSIARRGWRRTSVHDPLELRLNELASEYRWTFSVGQTNRLQRLLGRLRR